MIIELHKLKKNGGFLNWYDMGVPEKIYKQYSHLLEQYEIKSKKICIVCGKKGTIDYNESWFTPLCKKCRNKQRKEIL